jgi:hypothetical protein
MLQTHDLNSTCIHPRGFSFSGALFYQNSLVTPWWANRKTVRLNSLCSNYCSFGKPANRLFALADAEVKYQNLYFTKP